MLSSTLVFIQITLLGFFLFFAFFNFLYTFAAHFYKKPKKVTPSGKRVAIVIVSFNEKDVLLNTLDACEEIDYPKKTIIVGDDSKDGLSMETAFKTTDRAYEAAAVKGEVIFYSGKTKDD